MSKNLKINLFQGYLIIIEFLIINILLYLPFFFLKKHTSLIDSQTTNLIAYFLTHIILIIYLIKKFEIIDAFKIDTIKINYKLILIIVFITLIFNFLITPISVFLGLKNITDRVQELHKSGGIYFFHILIVSPLLEEIIFRKILFKGLNSKYNVFIALINSSLIFALIHFDLLQSFEAFFGGLLLGWIYYKTKSIIYPIITHFINNFFFAVDKTYFSNNFIFDLYDNTILINSVLIIFFLITSFFLIKYLLIETK